jgi:DNA-binding NtrC family response regulator
MAPTVLIVEFRDAVFSRLAGHFGLAGIRVVRARCGFEAMVQVVTTRPQLVVANAEMRGQSGWLLAAKISLLEPAPHVWLYKPEKTAADVAMANFVQAEELLEYGNDLDRLSNAVLGCLAGKRPEPGTWEGWWYTAAS